MHWVRRGVLLPQEHRDQERQESQLVPAGKTRTHLSTRAGTHARARARTHAPDIAICPQEHWKCGGHRKACPAYVAAAAAQAQQDRLCRAAVETDRCLICLGPPRQPTVLPCGHSFCTGCVSELRAKGVSQACPLCRAPLPPGPEKLYELGNRVVMKLQRAVTTVTPSGRPTWAPLSALQQEEMNGAIVMTQEAMDQVRERLGEI